MNILILKYCFYDKFSFNVFKEFNFSIIGIESEIFMPLYTQSIINSTF